MRLSHLFKDPIARAAVHAAEQEAREKVSSLTRQQLLVMEHVVEGKPNKVIAFELGLSQRTVENHRTVMLEKMGVKSATDLAKLLLLAS